MNHIRITLLLAIVFTAVSSAQPLSGAMLTHVSNTLSTSAPEAWADHALEFTTNTTVPENGEFEFRPQSGFFYIPSSFDHEDMDLLVRLPGEIEHEARSLGPIVSGTTSAVSVSDGSFGDITITFAEELPAGSEVKIRLGTHAEIDHDGEYNIRNPSVPRSYEFFLETRDVGGAEIDAAKAMVAIIEPVTVEGAFDLDVPERFNGLPDGELPGDTESASISVETDIFALCRYAEEPGIDYNDMPYAFTVDFATLHSEVIEVESEEEYSFYVRCENTVGEYNEDDYEISFSVAEEPTDEAEPGDPDDDDTEDLGGSGGSSGGGGGGAGGGTGNIVGPGDGEEHPPHTGTVIVEGWAYPNATLTVLQDGTIVFEGAVSADFSQAIEEIGSGSYTFSVYVTDNDGNRSATESNTLSVRSNTTNRIGDIFLPPTISPDGESVDPGQTLSLFGFAYPGASMEFEVLSGDTVVEREEFTVSESGQWSYDVSTAGMSNGTYIAQVRTTLSDGSRRSDWATAAFGVGVDPDADTDLTADLNNDGRVNLADFSILLFHWGTDSPIADINGDGNVGLADFSIMLFQWTG